MATESFLTEFKFKSKSLYKLLKAIENSGLVDKSLAQKGTDIKDGEQVNKILDTFATEDKSNRL